MIGWPLDPAPQSITINHCLVTVAQQPHWPSHSPVNAGVCNQPTNQVLHHMYIHIYGSCSAMQACVSALNRCAVFAMCALQYLACRALRTSLPDDLAAQVWVMTVMLTWVLSRRFRTGD
jgi:hypothetical protein